MAVSNSQLLKEIQNVRTILIGNGDVEHIEKSVCFRLKSVEAQIETLQSYHTKLSPPPSKNSNRKVMKIWQHDGFWKLAHRFMVITMFFLFLILSSVFGWDYLNNPDSIIAKILGF